MKIKIVKLENGSFSLLNEDSSEIENYSFDSTIDFHKLMLVLIDKELSEKIELIDEYNKDELNEQEKKLIILITSIVNMYNDRVDILNKKVEGIAI